MTGILGELFRTPTKTSLFGEILPERLIGLVIRPRISRRALYITILRASEEFPKTTTGISDLEFFLGITRLREYPYTFLKRMKNCSMIRLPGLIRIRVADRRKKESPKVVDILCIG